MNSKFKISIPKPCHEDWNKMTPNEKGKFCNSCSKTVVDFTKKSTEDIQEYLANHQHQRVCGHFYKKQLDSIVIEIPQIALEEQLSFQKLFILVLFIVMGTTLFSCQYSNGQKQKIEDVIITDTIKKIDTLNTKKESKTDTTIIKNNLKLADTIITTEGIVFCPIDDEPKDSLPLIEVVGDLKVVEGEVEIEEVVFGFIALEETPRFKEDKNLSKENAKDKFDKRINRFVQENFDLEITNNLGLEERKYKIFSQFTIDEEGNANDFKVRAPHPKIEKEVLKLLEKLPKFIPGQQNGRAVKTKYTLPISFIIE